jgi:dihydropteroate synthase
MHKKSDEDTIFPANKAIQLAKKSLSFERTQIMGILNLTNDSFHKNSRVQDESQLIETARQMIADGADILDLGASSSRPGANEVPLHLEREKIHNATRLIREHFPLAIISIDTFRSEVAEAGLSEGADMINDISSGELDPKIIDIVKKHECPYIIMHMRGTPLTMQSKTDYKDVNEEVIDYFKMKLKALRQAGIKDIIIDPGIGFAKTVDQNFDLIQNMKRLQGLSCPVLYGISRKSFIQKTIKTNSDDSLNGSTAIHSFLVDKGAAIIRVHDVKEAKQTVDLILKLKEFSNIRF